MKQEPSRQLPQDLRCPRGLLEPDAWKAGTSGSEGAPAQQCAGATRRCHFHARVSGRLLERGIRRYYLHRWPSQRSMKRVRAKIKALTGRNRAHQDIRDVIDVINPILRGWGNYFRTGNAARKFNQLDEYVWRRLRRLLMSRYGRNLHAGRADAWTRDWFVEQHGLHRLRGTVRYPGAA